MKREAREQEKPVNFAKIRQNPPLWRVCGIIVSMLPKQYRLTKMKDFEILFKEGRFYSSPLLQAKIWKIEPEKYPRRQYLTGDLKIGFVVSTKIDKRAVVRNRLKRQMREVVRLLLKDTKLKVGFMMLFIAKKETVGKEYGEIEKSAVELLKK